MILGSEFINCINRSTVHVSNILWFIFVVSTKYLLKFTVHSHICLHTLFVCWYTIIYLYLLSVFVCCWTSSLRIFHSSGNVIITAGEWLQKVNLYSAPMVFKQGGILLLSPVIIFVVPCRGTRQFNHLFTKSKDWWEPDLPVIHTHWFGSFKGRLKFWNLFITALHRQWCMTSPYDLTTDASKRDT